MNHFPLLYAGKLYLMAIRRSRCLSPLSRTSTHLRKSAALGQELTQTGIGRWMINLAGEAVSDSRTIAGAIGYIWAITAKCEFIKGYGGTVPQFMEGVMMPPYLSQIIHVDPAQVQMAQLGARDNNTVSADGNGLHGTAAPREKTPPWQLFPVIPARLFHLHPELGIRKRSCRCVDPPLIPG